MAAIFTIFCALVCVFAIVYALKAYRDTQKYKFKIKQQEKSRPKQRC